MPLKAQVYDPVARDLLDKVSLKYKAYKSYKASYIRTAENASGKVLDTQKGELLVAGEKFVLTLPGQLIICNGTTLWTYLKDSKEVNITDYEPQADEITPQGIFTLYRQGYKYMYWGEQRDKKNTVQIVDLEPEDRTKEVLKVRLFINKPDKQMRRWIVFERGSNNRQTFTISKLQANLPVTDADFVFNKAKFPGVKEIDLRWLSVLYVTWHLY